MTTIKILLDRLVFPECPRWRGGSLWFADCHDGKVIQMSPDGDVVSAFEVPGGPAGMGWLPNGDLIVVSMAELCVYRRGVDGQLVRHADLSGHFRHHANDMVVDQAGYSYVGEVGFRPDEEARSTSVLLIRPDGAVAVAAEDMMTPNGSVIDDDHSYLVVAESRERRLIRFKIGTGGALSDRRIFAQLGPDEVPDGICLDAEGCIWVASPRAHAVIRVHPSGHVLERIETGRLKPYACMLGGADRRDLFVCLARDHDPSATRRERRGAIGTVRVETPGSGRP
ncbi:SMP-30/gluconolactonase/LRE family protein [Sphingomonas natans]|nr:SMP-30/gluconolactonase/LRE family protein [Sphingomonas sp. BIUV-7]